MAYQSSLTHLSLNMYPKRKVYIKSCAYGLFVKWKKNNLH